MHSWFITKLCPLILIHVRGSRRRKPRRGSQQWQGHLRAGFALVPFGVSDCLQPWYAVHIMKLSYWILLTARVAHYIWHFSHPMNVLFVLLHLSDRPCWCAHWILNWATSWRPKKNELSFNNDLQTSIHHPPSRASPIPNICRWRHDGKINKII